MRYDVILADPPWPFKTYSDKGKGRSPDKHYPTMSLNEICALSVDNLANDNCALFLWCVWPGIFEYAPKVIESWGFTYRTVAFVWTKANPSGNGHFLGLGYYTRANTEVCLLAVKGKMPVADRGVSEIIYSPVRRHSQKPDEQYGKIERLYPYCNYLELFARQKRQGWDSWGNEVKSDVELVTNV